MIPRDCEVCGKAYAPASASQRMCKAAACHRVRRRDHQRDYRAKHPDKDAAAQVRGNATRMTRYRADPEYRRAKKDADMRRYRARMALGLIFRETLVTRETYDRMHAEQRGRCAICHLPETAKNPSGQLKRLAVDHDAESGRVRGLLCARCNTAIGLIQHDPITAQSAVDYLLSSAAHVVPEAQRSALGSLPKRRTV